MKHQLFIVLLFVTACSKAPAPSQQSSIPHEAKRIQRSFKVSLFDKIGDTSIMSQFDKNGKLRYNHDSVKIYGLINSEYVKLRHDINEWEYPLNFELLYLHIYVEDDTEIDPFRFDYDFLIKWNWLETDSLKIVKDTDHEIRFYTNSTHHKTILSGERNPVITFYR